MLFESRIQEEEFLGFTHEDISNANSSGSESDISMLTVRTKDLSEFK